MKHDIVSYGVLRRALVEPGCVAAMLLPGCGPIPPTSALTPRQVQVLAAATLGHPVRGVEIERAVGRFMLVHYAPMAQGDPDVMIAALPGADRRYWQAIRAFQEARTWRVLDSWESWYTRVMDAARFVLSPLNELNPHPEEARFVLEWLLACASEGRRIGGGRR